MKFNHLIKSVPFLSTLLIIILIGISNQKIYTRLRILIWNTPSLSLGTYIAISTGTGFLFSYLLTTSVAKTNQFNLKKTLKYKADNNNEEINEFNEINSKSSYENTLIERDIKDPSPTINASFRVIGRKERNNSDIINDDKNNIQYAASYKYEEQYNEQNSKDETNTRDEAFLTDWNDQSFLTW